MLYTRLLALAVVFAVYDVTQANLGQVLNDCEADIVFCIDNSQSIAGSLAGYRPNETPEHYPSKNWRRMLTFSNNLVDRLNVKPGGSHIGLVDFGDNGYFDFDLKTYTTTETVKAAIASLAYRGERTFTNKGLDWALRLLTEAQFGKRGNDVEKVIILITDGEPSDQSKVQPAVDKIKALGIRIVVVFIAATDAIRAKEPQVKPIATRDKDYIRLNSFAELETYYGNIINEETCTRPPPPTIPTTTKAPSTLPPSTTPPTKPTVPETLSYPSTFPPFTTPSPEDLCYECEGDEIDPGCD